LGPLRRCRPLHDVVWPYRWSSGLSRGRWVRQVVVRGRAGVLGLTRRRGALHAIVGPFASLSGPSLRVGSYVASLGPLRRRRPLHDVVWPYRWSSGLSRGRWVRQVVVRGRAGVLGSWCGSTCWHSEEGWLVGEVGEGKWATTKVVARFCDAPRGPPISWVPPLFLPPVSPGRADLNRPTSL
jgi:hypothetical protein